MADPAATSSPSTLPAFPSTIPPPDIPDGAATHRNFTGIWCVGRISSIGSQAADGAASVNDPRLYRRHRTGYVRVLSIDGGGIRGIIPLHILERMEEEVHKRRLEQATEAERDTLKRWSTVDMFDLIAGTSTGGIIALALTECGMSVTDVKNFYLQKVSTVFNTSLLVKGMREVVNGAQYSSTPLEELMKSVCSEQQHKRVSGSMVTPFRRGPRAFAVTCNVSQHVSSSSLMYQLRKLGIQVPPKTHHEYDAESEAAMLDYTKGNKGDIMDDADNQKKGVHAARPHAFLLRNYETRSELQGTNQFRLWEGMRATSAAPTYWAPAVDQWGRVFVDGGVGNNNPTLLAYLEAQKLWHYDGSSVSSVDDGPEKHQTGERQERTDNKKLAIPVTSVYKQAHPELSATPCDTDEVLTVAVPDDTNPIGLVLSLGTGLADEATVSSSWIRRAGDWVSSALTTAEMVHDLCCCLFVGQFMPAYMRLQPRENVGAIALDESNPAKLQEMLDVTNRFLETEPYKTRFQILCDCLLVEQGSGKGGQLTAHDVEIRERMVGQAMKKKCLEENKPLDKATLSLLHNVI